MSEISRVECASAQVSAAIEMMFEGGNPIAVRTLVDVALGHIRDMALQIHGDASGIKPGNSIRGDVVEWGIKKDEFLSFAKYETLPKLFLAVEGLTDLCVELTEIQAFFQMWYLATHYRLMGLHKTDVQLAIAVAGDLNRLSRIEQIACGCRRWHAFNAA